MKNCLELLCVGFHMLEVVGRLGYDTQVGSYTVWNACTVLHKGQMVFTCRFSGERCTENIWKSVTWFQCGFALKWMSNTNMEDTRFWWQQNGISYCPMFCYSYQTTQHFITIFLILKCIAYIYIYTHNHKANYKLCWKTSEVCSLCMQWFNNLISLKFINLKANYSGLFRFSLLRLFCTLHQSSALAFFSARIKKIKDSSLLYLVEKHIKFNTEQCIM
jgi:hypothetical protein